jgi:uncharacterized protein with ParB-like and HNH nuclease domain
MKYADIVKHTRFPSPLNTDMKYLFVNLDAWGKDYGVDLNPDFQRGHVWTTQNRTAYLEFLLRGGRTPPFLFNSPAYAGNRATNSDLSDTIVLVDGKQRLSSIQLFIANAVPVFNGTLFDDFEDKNILLRSVGLEYSINSLQRKSDLLNWYLDMNSNCVAHDPKELGRVRLMLSKLTTH